MASWMIWLCDVDADVAFRGYITTTLPFNNKLKLE